MPNPVSQTRPVCGIDEHVGGLDVLVDQPASVEPTDRAGQRHGESEKSPISIGCRRGDREARLPCTRPRASSARARARVPAAAMPRRFEVLSKFVFVGEAIDALERRMLGAGRDGYERVRLAAASSRQ